MAASAFHGRATAESYLLERDLDRLDDYYREGKERSVEHGAVGVAGTEMGALTPEQFRAWMEHRDPKPTRCAARSAAYFHQLRRALKSAARRSTKKTIISVDKTSLAAAANPRAAAALEQAMSRACTVAAGGRRRARGYLDRAARCAAASEVRPYRVHECSAHHESARRPALPPAHADPSLWAKSPANGGRSTGARRTGSRA
ncbi:MAG: hypothetical protein R2722_18400 [Tessaracoccus sp.]